MPDTEETRRAFFDIHCQSATGERFIVEMQKARIKHFKDRALFYTSFPIREQTKVGRWDFELAPVYLVAVLDFFYEKEEEAIFRRDVLLKDQTNAIFSDKLNFIFLQMPAFRKTEAELETRFEKWAYFLKNLENFNHIPAILNEPIFSQAFYTAEVSKMDAVQRESYELSKFDYYSVQLVYEAAIEQGIEQGFERGLEEGREEGREEGKKQATLETAKNLKNLGLSLDIIKQSTGLSSTEIENL